MRGRTLLEQLFEGERQTRDAESRILQIEPEDELIDLLQASVAEAKELEDRDEANLRLYRLAELCAQVPGPEMVEALTDILDEDDPTLRATAGEALLDVAYDRYAEVARAIEQRLDEGSMGPAMRELPFIIAEIGEPSAVTIIARFLGLSDEAAVASAIEAMASLQDPKALKFLRPLLADPRTVWTDDEDETPTTIAKLAEEAIQFLEQLQ